MKPTFKTLQKKDLHQINGGGIATSPGLIITNDLYIPFPDQNPNLLVMITRNTQTSP